MARSPGQAPGPEKVAQKKKPASVRPGHCLLCASPRLELVLPLAPTPIADEYVTQDKVGQPQTAYPLDVSLCLDCGHVQLMDVVDPDLLFGNYIYVSTSSPGLVEHFRQAAQRLMDTASPPAGGLALDIGSNDGTLLRFLKEHGLKILGVDPARETAERATESGVETLPAYFTSALARKVRAERGPAALITANNVFAHSQTLPDMADGVRELLSDSGVFVFEVSYLLDLVEQMVWDSIYHEHLCYHSVKPLKSFLERHGLELVDAERISTKGGSLRCIAQKKGGPRKTEARVGELLALEAHLGLDKPKYFLDYAARIDRLKKELLAVLDVLIAKGKTVAGFGASATSTTLLHHFDLGGRLKFLMDDNALKQGRFSPGHHIPVLKPEALYERKPDYVVVLAWRFAPMILKKQDAYLKAGGHFIIPLPKLQVLP